MKSGNDANDRHVRRRMKKSLIRITVSKRPKVEFVFQFIEGSDRATNATLTVTGKNELIYLSKNAWDLACVIAFCLQLDELKAGRRKRVGFGGSEGAFSTTFTITKSSFHLLLHHFGEPMTFEKTWVTRLHVVYSKRRLAALMKHRFPGCTSAQFLQDPGATPN